MAEVETLHEALIDELKDLYNAEKQLTKALPKLARARWHAYRRKWATERKHHPLKDIASAGGWKNVNTLLTCYQQPDTETQREALARRKRYRAGPGG